MRKSSIFRRLRRLPLAWWTIALLLALVAGFTITTSVAAAERSASRYEDRLHVVVATRDLAPGTPVAPGDVRTEMRPRAFVPGGEPAASPVGRVASVPVIEGEILFNDKLAPSGSSAVAAMLEPGERAINVPSNEATPPVSVGDSVDAIVAVHGAAPSSGAESLLLAAGARVIAVGEDAVTVASPQTDALRLAAGVAEGKVTLTVSAPFE